MECHSNLFGPFRLVNGDIVLRAYENIIDVIKGRSNKKSIDYYEAVRIAYNDREYMQIHRLSNKRYYGNKQRIQKNMAVHIQNSKWRRGTD